MFYRLTANLNYTDYDPLNDLLEELARRFPQALTINPGGMNYEPSFYTVQRCFHDQDLTAECQVLEHHISPP